MLRQRGHETLVVDRDNYYVKRHVVPTLHRVLMCAGANVKQWDAELPRPRVVVRYRGFAARAEGYGSGGGGAAAGAERSGLVLDDRTGTILNHFSSQRCVACRQGVALARSSFCAACVASSGAQRAAAGSSIYAALRAAQRQHNALRDVCVRCAGGHRALGCHLGAGCAVSHPAQVRSSFSVVCSYSFLFAQLFFCLSPTPRSGAPWSAAR